MRCVGPPPTRTDWRQAEMDSNDPMAPAVTSPRELAVDQPVPIYAANGVHINELFSPLATVDGVRGGDGGGTAGGTGGGEGSLHVKPSCRGLRQRLHLHHGAAQPFADATRAPRKAVAGGPL